MVEAAGVEPFPPKFHKWMMAHEFWSKRLMCLRLGLIGESSRVIGTRQESSPVVETWWRRGAGWVCRARSVVRRES